MAERSKVVHYLLEIALHLAHQGGLDRTAEGGMEGEKHTTPLTAFIASILYSPSLVGLGSIPRCCRMLG